jgi:three-Cys-motif partner protein
VTSKSYEWEDGAELGEHSQKKHQILREYFRQYLKTRCQLPQQEKFKLAIVDGFSGGGLYDTLIQTAKEINIYRNSQGFAALTIECLIVFNDKKSEAIHLLKQNLAPHLAAAEEQEGLIIHPQYFSDIFEQIYPEIKKRLLATRCNNVLFNLDQCGYSHVTTACIRDIMISWKSAEVILTFMIKALLTFLSPNEKKNGVRLEPEMQEKVNSLLENDKLLSKREWMGEAEKIVYSNLNECAPYVSPFAINNPGGWKYWLMHFARSYRARQVYNDVLHQHGEAQAHVGGAGLNMLSYTPQNNGFYLFDDNSRDLARSALAGDIPDLVSHSGDTIPMLQFYETAYSETPAHSEDIHQAIIDNPDLEVVTKNGGVRRKAGSIKSDDTLRLTNQKSFFFGTGCVK